MPPKFGLRFCPALAQKPGGTLKESEDRPKPDPFENPAPELLVAEVPGINPSHLLVLNKFPVITNHFILATKALKPQTALLEQDDLSIAFACLQAWEQDSLRDQPRRLFAFFNSGEHSGASQIHRHVQFLPVEDMAGCSGTEWKPLLDRMDTKRAGPWPPYYDPGLPFLHYATQLFEKITPQNLHRKYIHLLRAAVCGVRRGNAEADFTKDIQVEQYGEAVISYNLAMTADMMAIIPRRAEAAEVPAPDGGHSSVPINGTILGGTLMVKAEYEWNALKETPALLDEILRTIGYTVSTTGDVDKTKL